MAKGAVGFRVEDLRVWGFGSRLGPGCTCGYVVGARDNLFKVPAAVGVEDVVAVQSQILACGQPALSAGFPLKRRKGTRLTELGLFSIWVGNVHVPGAAVLKARVGGGLVWTRLGTKVTIDVTAHSKMVMVMLCTRATDNEVLLEG